MNDRRLVKLGQLRSAEGNRKRRKRLGRGSASGHGKTSGKGHKGQKARSGGGVRPGFEGGQMPLSRRVPKRGFSHPGSRNLEVNVGILNRFPAGSQVNSEQLRRDRLIKKKGKIKMLGKGSLKKPLTVVAHRFSQQAKQKIEKAGGKIVQC